MAVNFHESDEAKRRQTKDYDVRRTAIFERLRRAIQPSAEDQHSMDFRLGRGRFQAHALNDLGDIEFQITLYRRLPIAKRVQGTRVRVEWRSLQPEAAAREVLNAYMALVKANP